MTVPSPAGGGLVHWKTLEEQEGRRGEMESQEADRRTRQKSKHITHSIDAITSDVFYGKCTKRVRLTALCLASASSCCEHTTNHPRHWASALTQPAAAAAPDRYRKHAQHLGQARRLPAGGAARHVLKVGRGKLHEGRLLGAGQPLDDVAVVAGLCEVGGRLAATRVPLAAAAEAGDERVFAALRGFEGFRVRD